VPEITTQINITTTVFDDGRFSCRFTSPNKAKNIEEALTCLAATIHGSIEIVNELEESRGDSCKVVVKELIKAMRQARKQGRNLPKHRLTQYFKGL
jgi:hypothetical protein